MERDELEVNYDRPDALGIICEKSQFCKRHATREIEVKRVLDPRGVVFHVCDLHSDAVFDMYRALDVPGS